MLQTQQDTSLEILYADDDKDDRIFFKKALDGISIATTLKTFSDGQQLMDYLYQNTEQLPYALFLDINMPRKNGCECLMEIKSNEQLKKIPVILCSTSMGDDYADTLYKNGGHYYLHKCDFAELKKSIFKILTLLSITHVQPSRNKFMFSLWKV